jgi:nitrous oxide reductase accessory protein NosL
MKLLLSFIALSFVLLSFSGCEESHNTNARQVHYDRDMCSRCAMVVSDRKNTTQVINPKTNKVYMFDDIGCMVLWFDEEKIPWKNEAIIWITDVDTGEWIDARKAFYDTENITPMAYGFSAHKTKEAIKEGQEIINYNEVVRRVKEIGR